MVLWRKIGRNVRINEITVEKKMLMGRKITEPGILQAVLLNQSQQIVPIILANGQ